MLGQVIDNNILSQVILHQSLTDRYILVILHQAITDCHWVYFILHQAMTDCHWFLYIPTTSPDS